MLEKGTYALGWTTVRVPFVPREVWPSMVRLRVKGTANGFAFRNSLFPSADGRGFVLLINKKVQSGAGVVLGSLVDLVLEPDMEARPAELPEVLEVLLDGEEGLREWYDTLSESMRREIGKWVLGVKSEEAQVRRAEQMAERLLGAMEGERELPPVIEVAFRKRPKARAGWAKMTDTQRKQSLLAVFYYQTPEARAKRVEKLCDEAEKKA